MLLGDYHVPQSAINKAVRGGEPLHVMVCGAEFTIGHDRAIVRPGNFSKVLQLQPVRDDPRGQVRFEVVDEGIMYVVYQDYVGNDPCTFEVHDLLRGKAAPPPPHSDAYWEKEYAKAFSTPINEKRKQVLLLC